MAKSNSKTLIQNSYFRKMTRYIAILRGINVGGKKKVLMKDLKVIFKEIGFLNIHTYVQSGNVVFDSKKDIKPKKLELQIENALLSNYNFEVSVIIKTPEELKTIISGNLFKPTKNSIKRHYLVFLKETPEIENIKKLEAWYSGDDEFILKKNVIYLKYFTRYSDSKLNNNLFEKKLNVIASTRNWTSILKLDEICKSD